MLVENSNLKSIPSNFTFTNDPTGSTAESLPTIDFSMLTSAELNQRSKVIHDLGKACEEWGFFVLVNHGIPETLRKGIIDACSEYYELPEEEKHRYEAKSVSDPIKTGSGNLVNNANQRVQLWRDFVKTYVHPEFHCPPRPQILRDILFEFSEKSRSVARKLIQGVGENLGFEEGYIDEALELDSIFQVFAANFYPRCPHPDQAIGIPSHTDPGLFTFLIHNGVAGLQIEHDGQWFNADSPRDSILVVAGDHLEIFTNGRYKSVKHKAVLNSERQRVSIVVSHGPSVETVVGPAAPLVLKEGRALYRSMKYKDYMEWLQTKSRLHGRSMLEQQMMIM
ncbi:leucoanthocyanidin dioxygenase [Phtheirospermum japonicum]|uniref:Leucoanthocyanidin dioxygenase n=1 Tax=Phtheirospermum japonicum TaxID=374723 RepID=A0A830BXJ1_9LAMI|nr:leucoanthocyanidin dioxygenase [Phtheirospermum japonicum]